MVKLEEVADEQAPAAPAFSKEYQDDEDDWVDGSDSESEFSDDESDVSERGVAIHEESIWDRLSALRDIIPPSTRQSIAQTISTTTSYATLGGRLVGNLVWVVTTSALLVGLPFALAVEDESRLVAQEKEMLSQQQGAQMLGTGSPDSQQQPGQVPFGAQSQGLRPPGF